MIRSANPLAQEPRYELITRVLRSNIRSGTIPEGFVLLEGPIAAVMQTSRVPVQSALRQLLDENLIHRFDGRGYLVGSGAQPVVPLRRDIRDLPLDIPAEVDDALQTRGTWRHVYDQVEEEVASCQIFGEFRIVETELADYLGVSRTVVRDVLARLQERGLIRKSASSHWIAGPLTARTVSEKFQLRSIVEPAALRLAAPHIRYADVETVLDRIGKDPAISSEYLGDALLELCIAQAPNTTLVEMIRSNGLLLSAVDRALIGLGLPRDETTIEQYHTLFDLIARHPIDSAAEYLRDHLSIVARRYLARMKIVAVISETGSFSPYLSPV
ncbi:GntR family transcriptional regulator [Pseudotabrizicola sp.]|uniref:GntR family transcriptional regulator n=1 Tax=Pseudotabrizicola sp. TaxID=2939647 RepID=UPI002719DAF1|nr:GntR family transcriptional regulator [Pseudotabrizicola sp.]MDO8882108.1 GntR family transcriptional regulator [Pseudotabrizicola sp.]